MRGKTIPAEIVRRTREAARNRCGYCLAPQRIIGGHLEIDHIYPVAKGGSDDEENLWLACSLCNEHKSAKTEAVDPDTGQLVPLFNPRRQSWTDHFQWADNGWHIIGLTPIGRATVLALHMNTDFDAISSRRVWVMVKLFPPQD